MQSFMPSLYIWLSSALLYSLLKLSASKPLSQSREKLVLLISFDGFRWDYLNRGLTPTFNKFASDGGKANYTIDAFITKTFPNHYTLVTGLYEESHGIVANDIYDPILHERFSLGNLDPKWWSQNGQEPIWITNQRQGGSSGVVDYPGMDVKFDGMLPNFEYDAYNETVPFNERIDFTVELFSNESINFAALYFHEPDRTGHLFGPDSKEMNETLKLCDDTMNYLIQKLKDADLYDKINIIVTSDHGMASTDLSQTIFAVDYLNGTVYPYFTTDNNPVLGIWPYNTSHVDPLYQAMKKAPHISVYKKDEIPKEYHYRNNVRIPPIVAVADEGWMLRNLMVNFSNLNPVKGDHGYNNSLMSMHPFFLVHGPAFHPGSICPPFSSVDVYPLMCHLLGIKPRPNNGTLKIVQQLLKEFKKGPRGTPDTGIDGRHNDYFTVGIAFACVLVMLAIVLVTGMCLRQRKYRQTQRIYHTLDDGIDSEDEEIFEDHDKMLPSTNI
ncbi:Ectonucleotide pyrophosphatase/phosphodiesterase family member 5 [Holothuria leucospilota]|uniref:Ectonucleotide pyrophosphatase/phosphodiesterase family member 5 n=1 Tax=Holothuria leucospilota TaxID=206669 RepID=A0A9Q1CC48_HOLLE|nr:Ectonucleotide pyrophosphatase/phosphodiesterase family member 5 [Holothuria leucospilota]